MQRLHEEESKAVQASLKELGEKLEAASRGREQEAARRTDALEQLQDVRSAAEKLRVTVSAVLYCHRSRRRGLKLCSVCRPGG